MGIGVVSGADMAIITPAMHQRLAECAQALAQAPHGSKQAIKDAACAELDITLATLHRYLKQVSVAAAHNSSTRKKRSDAGAVSLSRDEAVIISALLQGTARKNATKRLLSVADAVEYARANGQICAEFLDKDGVLRPLSTTAIARALRVYNLHPDQLNRPAPATELKSLHPNHVWQLDASLCVLYYLHAENEQEAGLQVMEHDAFYKNKPRNLKRIEAERVWSYEATDHYSGYIFLRYVLGAESGLHAAESLIHFMHQREGEVAHGVPFILYTDQGIKSAQFVNMLRRLGIRHELHAAGNARATGQVENARNIIERSFEPALRLRPVGGLEDLNTQASRWAAWFNANKQHSRHGMTRSAMWQTIRAVEQLRVAPGVDVCRALMNDAPQSRVISPTLTVSFGGQEYDVRNVPGVAVGERLAVATNPYAQDAVYIVERDAEGYETLYTAPLVARDAAGFRSDANVIGEARDKPAETVLDTNRKEVERTIYAASTDKEAQAAKKSRATPFGGSIDPYKSMERDLAATANVRPLPKRGTPLEVTTKVAPTPTPVQQAIKATPAPTAKARTLTHFEAAQWLANTGEAGTPEMLSRMLELYPAGVSEDELPTLREKLAAPAFGGLRVVAGGAQ